jgi:hypothetical protein
VDSNRGVGCFGALGAIILVWGTVPPSVTTSNYFLLF